MTANVKYDPNHHSGSTPEQRIANRLRNSGGDDANHIVQKGSGPTRTFTNIHHSGHYVQPGTGAKESGPTTQRHSDAAKTQGSGGTP